ncbi:MAG: DAK2 domain-containing protein [Candidatus Atribacteria bacterium]|nr:DAK2 domain-containing protein [Candidatus Atribacteria bacterium]MCD6349671.1 DAK2 domain-containing protein [Candidatus Atribacteria bacterium]
MLQEAIKMARVGMESSKNMLSRRSQSSRLGEHSIGCIDPGAVSSIS